MRPRNQALALSAVASRFGSFLEKW